LLPNRNCFMTECSLSVLSYSSWFLLEGGVSVSTLVTHWVVQQANRLSVRINKAFDGFHVEWEYYNDASILWYYAVSLGK
jgi:hypothetical protein